MESARPRSPSSRVIEDAQTVLAELRRRGSADEMTLSFACMPPTSNGSQRTALALAYLLGAGKVDDAYSVVHGRFLWQPVTEGPSLDEFVEADRAKDDELAALMGIGGDR